MDSAERIGGEPSAVLVAAFTGAGTIIGNTLRINPLNKNDGWAETPNLYAAVIGAPSVKKSPLLSEGLRPLNALQNQANIEHAANSAARSAAASTRKIRVTQTEHQLRKATDETEITTLQQQLTELFNEAEADDEHPRTYVVQDSTVPRLAIDLGRRVNRGGTLVYQDELAGIFKTMGSQGREGDRPFYLTAYNGTEPYSVHRVDRNREDLYLQPLTLSMLGAVQPAVLAPFVKAAATGRGDDGFLERFQVHVWLGERTSGVNRPVNKAALDRAHEIYTVLAAAAREREGRLDMGQYEAVTFTDEAQSHIDQWNERNDERIRGSQNLGYTAHLAKSQGAVARIALIIYAIDVADGGPAGVVTLEHARNATGLMDFFHQHAEITYGLFTAEARHFKLTDLRGALESQEVSDGMTIRNFMRTFNRFGSDKATVMHLLSAAEDMNWLRVEAQATGGRRSEVIRVNPAFL